MIRLARKFIRHARLHGVGSALSVSRRHLTGSVAPDPVAASDTGISPRPAPASARRKSDVIGFYENIFGFAHGADDDPDLTDAGRDTLQWVIPNFGFGSGGHQTIFRFVNLLAERGVKQNVVILPPHNWRNGATAKRAIREWYFEIDADITLGIEGFRPAFSTIATGWQTAYWVAKYQATRQRFYFVQDFEPAFYSVSSEYYLAENTYRLGLRGITAGTWLSGKLHSDYGMKCDAFSFSYDRKLYVRQPKQPTPDFNIMFYARHGTKRRLFELGLCALKQVCDQHPEVVVTFFGGDVGGYDIPFRHVNAAELPIPQLPALYSQSDLGLLLSGTNLSLIPLEAAACLCPVVMNDTPSARWLLPESAAYYAPMDPDGMAATILGAISDEKGRNARAQAAQRIAEASSWQDEGDRMFRLISGNGE